MNSIRRSLQLSSFLLAVLSSTLFGWDGTAFQWRGALAQGQLIEIKGINGSVHAEPGPGNEVVIEARRSGHRDDPATVAIQVVPHAGGITVCAVYPSEVPRSGECQPGSAPMSTHNNDVRVEFVVHVPRGVKFTGRTVNGNVEATALTADVEAYSVNGKINISTSGAAQANTVNGSIIASIGRVDWTALHEFTSINGSVDIALPSSANADVHVKTVNGSILTDFPIVGHGRLLGKSMEGKLGTGGRALKVTSVNGSIHLRRF